jgi:hypothetical protein
MCGEDMMKREVTHGFALRAAAAYLFRKGGISLNVGPFYYEAPTSEGFTADMGWILGPGLGFACILTPKETDFV